MAIALTSLSAYWKLNEASNVTRVDSSGNGNDLADVNTVAAAAGKVDNGALFVVANLETLQIADNASLSCGDVDFFIACWVKLTSKTATSFLVAKDNSTTVREYALQYNQVFDRFRFFVSNNGTTGTAVNADTFGIPSVGVWYFVVAWHDSVNNVLKISVNDGAVDSIAHTTGCNDNTASFCVGSAANVAFFADATIDEVSFWKRILTAAEITELYGAGFGDTYPFTVSTVTKTVKPGGGGDFTTLAAWQTSRKGNLRGRNTIEVAECYGGDVDPIVLDGWDTDATRYVKIAAASSAKHAGIFSTSSAIAHLSAGATTAMEIREDYTQIADLCIDGSAALINIIDAANVLMERVILDGGSEAVQLSGVSGSAILRNSVIQDCDIGVHANGAAAAITVQNCTVQALTGGAFKVDNSGTITEQNNYAKISSGTIYTVISGTINKGANTATSNTEATTVALRSIAFSTANFVNVTNGSEDLHLTSTSALKNVGADLSASFTDDFEGIARGLPFDIGADQNLVDPDPVVRTAIPPQFLNRYLHRRRGEVRVWRS